MKRQYQTNVYGPLFATQAALPGMRERRAGTVVNVRSVGGQDAQPSSGLYASSKFAFEGISEALAREVAEFGIRVLVEPGAFRTNFLHAVHQPERGLPPDYAGTVVEAAFNRFADMTGRQPGDPAKAVERIF